MKVINMKYFVIYNQKWQNRYVYMSQIVDAMAAFPNNWLIFHGDKPNGLVIMICWDFIEDI